MMLLSFYEGLPSYSTVEVSSPIQLFRLRKFKKIYFFSGPFGFLPFLGLDPYPDLNLHLDPLFHLNPDPNWFLIHNANRNKKYKTYQCSGNGIRCLYNSLKIGPNFFLQHFKIKIVYNFVKFVATKKVWQQFFFSSLSFVPVFGSGIGDPGSGINIPDPQHWNLLWKFIYFKVSFPSRSLLSVPVQLPGHCGGLCLSDLHIRRLRHRIPQNSPCPACAPSPQGYQQVILTYLILINLLFKNIIVLNLSLTIIKPSLVIIWQIFTVKFLNVG